jgi:hypothetical protein
VTQPPPARHSWVQLSDDFYKTVGLCITAWANVDEVLFAVFRQCVGPLDQCAIIYFRTPGLDARLALTDEIVQSVLPKKKAGEHDHPDVIAWTKARKEFQTLLSTRRRIAHHHVVARAFPAAFGGFGGMFDDGPHISSFEIYASKNERLRGRESGQKPLALKDLQNHLALVTLLEIGLGKFLGDVLLKRAEELPPPVPQNPQATVPKKDTAKARQPRRKPSPR